MNKQLTDTDVEPWYKQGWPWVLIAIPLLTVIAGVITIQIAFDTNDSLVKDNYYKEGLAINSSIERTELAHKLALSAKIEINSETKLLHVNLSSAEKLPSRLMVKFSHPTLEVKDQSFALESLSGRDFVSEIISLEDAYWHVTIEDESKTWILKSRWLYPTKTSIIVDSRSKDASAP